MTRENEEPQKKRRRRLPGRKSLIALGVFIALLIWLNGPGWRWIGGMVLRHELDQAGLKADFVLSGTLINGIAVDKLSVSGGPIRKLEIGSAGPLYRVRQIIHGELKGVAVERVDVVIDLDGPPLPSKKPSPPPKPFDPQELAATLRKVRGILRPMYLNIHDVRFQLVKGADSLMVLDTSGLIHQPGDDQYRLNLGGIAVGAAYSFPAQVSVFDWQEESLSLDRFDLTQGLGVRDLALKVPQGGAPSAAGVVSINDSRLVLAGDLSSATLRMEGAPLVVQDAAKNVALGSPVDVTINALDAKLEDFQKPLAEWKGVATLGLRDIRYRDLSAGSLTLTAAKAPGTGNLWNATAKAEVGNFSFQDWQVPALTLDAAKTADTADATWAIQALDSQVNGKSHIVWRDLKGGDWSSMGIDNQGNIADLAPLTASLKARFQFAPPEAPPLPAAALAFQAGLEIGHDGVQPGEAKIDLTSADPLNPSLHATAKWADKDRLSGTLAIDGGERRVDATYGLDLGAKRYEGTAKLSEMSGEAIAAWTNAFGVKIPDGLRIDADWSGSGAFAASPHTGNFDLKSFKWLRVDSPALTAHSKGSYDWPKEVTVSETGAETDGQIVNLEAKFADQSLKISHLEWKQGTETLLSGQALVPVPPPGSMTAKDFLKQTEPLNLFIDSEVIPLAKLAPWLPDKKSPFEAGTGHVHLIIGGTPAQPQIELDAGLKGMKVANQPDVPVTDVSLKVDATGDTTELKGEIRPASYPTVTLGGKMPFHPGAWADDPQSALHEKFEAHANIPKLELGTFKKFVPAADHLAGTLEGTFGASGEIGKPVLGGKLRLTNGALTLKDSKVPPFARLNVALDMEGKAIKLSGLSLESAGGTVSGSGTADLADAANPHFNLSLKGNALPIARDDSMIVRADANLALQGTLKEAKISGQVDVVDSLYYRDFEILPVRVPFTAPSRPKLPAIDADKKAAGIPEPFNHWALDVHVVTRDPLLVRGNLADGSAIADVRFGGTLGNIRPSGTANILKATASLPFSRLKVNDGLVTFTPDHGLNPDLNIRGTSTIGRYDVSVFFYGPLNDPKTALTSDPPLAESEIMTLLATGTTSDGLEGGQAASLKAAQLLVEEWRKGRLPFGEQVAKVVAVLNKVDLRIGEDDPLSGKRLNSATIEIRDKWYASGSVDKDGNTRVLGAFVLKFK